MMLGWSAFIGAAGAVMISATVASAQYRQDYYYYPGQIDRPGPNRGDTVYGAPRPDFPGAERSETSARPSKKHRSGAAK
jgi:hypothetical protein